MVAVDNAGNLKAAAYGTVPSDVRPGQTSRDGEDYAVAMGGHTTKDPLPLHTDCEGTIATVSGPKCKVLGAGVPSTRLEQASGFHDEVRAAKVKGHLATQRDVEVERTSHLSKRRNEYADIFAKKGVRHTQACFSGRQDSCGLCLPGHASGAMGGRGPRLAHVQSWGRHQGCRAKSTDPRLRQVRCAAGFLPSFLHASHKTAISTHARSEGTACSWDEFSVLWSCDGPCHHLLRQMRSSVLGTSLSAVPHLQRNPGGRTWQLRKLR